jgi:hypothetical protein
VGVFERQRKRCSESIENNGCWEKRHQTKEEKMNGIITHILRFPPGARVTLTNRRLYCALFPVLLVLISFICVASWMDGWHLADWSRDDGPYGISSDCRLMNDIRNSIMSLQTFARSVRSYTLSFQPLPRCSPFHRPCLPMSTAVAILSPNIVIAVSTRFRSDLPFVFQFDP